MCIRLLSIFALKFAKNMFCQRKVDENSKYHETEGLWWEKYKKLQNKIQITTNHQTKENVLNQIKEIENSLKISINTEINLRETRAIAAIKKTPKYFYKFVKNNSKIRAGIGPLQDEEGNLEPSNKKMSELLNEQYNSIFTTPDPTRLLSIQRTSLDTHREIHCHTLILEDKTSLMQ